MPYDARSRSNVLVGAGVVLATVLALAALERTRRKRCQLRDRRRLALRATSRYAAAVLSEASSKRGFILDSTAHCQLGDFARIDWDCLLKGDDASCRVSCLYLRAGLVRKGMLAHYLKKRKVGGVLPPGFAADVEDEEDLESLRKLIVNTESLGNAGSSQSTSQDHPTWVAKASNANRGEHLYLASSVDELVASVRSAALEGDEKIIEWVVQRYIHPPLLLHGRKFHLRAHLLLSGCPCCGTTRAWLHEKSIVALASSVSYDNDVPGESRCKHLTNHCVQEAHPSFEESKQILLLEEVVAILGMPALATHILASISSALAESLKAAASAPAGFAPLPQCFELMGADFTLEDRGSELPGVFMLEVNAGPDMAIFGKRLYDRCVAMAEDVLQVAVEPYLLHEACATSKFAANPEGCRCAKATAGTSFGACLWSAAPRTGSLGEELTSFKRRLSIAGQWAKALHEDSGVQVRGPQAQT